MKSVQGKAAPKTSVLFAELEALAKYIQDAKKEISALSPDEVKDDFLPTASDELDAIIGATADATNVIMDSTELVEEVMAGLDGDAAQKLMTATTQIYEACGFQDITGQRITKVVSTLKSIEEKVDGLLAVFGDGANSTQKKSTKKTKTKIKKEITDEDLLNGPQSTDKAKSQAEIDALLASFD
ncbi:MAG: protein phosphatase CheZ [Rhodospirillales bacterium]|nr:protein phosphatase CheZ [Rhodospirillales bacterium]